MTAGWMETIEPGPRSQLAQCANLAAMRARDAKAAGAGYAVQDRILDMAFLLCLSGSPTAD